MRKLNSYFLNLSLSVYTIVLTKLKISFKCQELLKILENLMLILKLFTIELWFNWDLLVLDLDILTALTEFSKNLR